MAAITTTSSLPPKIEKMLRENWKEFLLGGEKMKKPTNRKSQKVPTRKKPLPVKKAAAAEWINVKDAKPTQWCCVVVFNDKGYMYEATQAMYNPNADVFYTYSDRNKILTLEVSHWLLIPEYPPMRE